MTIVSKDMIKRVLLEALRALRQGNKVLAEEDILEALSMLDYIDDNNVRLWCWP